MLFRLSYNSDDSMRRHYLHLEDEGNNKKEREEEEYKNMMVGSGVATIFETKRKELNRDADLVQMERSCFQRP